jgi:type III protein arginine methyltransferase
MTRLDPLFDTLTIDVKTLLTKGERSLEQWQLNDAAMFFSSVLQSYPHDLRAQKGLETIRFRMTDFWHGQMLNDSSRNKAFRAALERAIHPGQLVLDIGTGTGLLSIMAAQCGANVITCEMNPFIAQIAEQIIDQNGFSDQIRVIAKKSTELKLGADLPSPADLLVTETIGPGFLDEFILPTLLHAQENLLAKDAIVLPMGGTVYGMLVESEALWRMNHVTEVEGLDISLFNQKFSRPQFPRFLRHFPHNSLSDPFKLFSFSFQPGDRLSLEDQQTLVVVPQRTGICHAVVLWFELQVDQDISIVTSPDNEETHWMQMIQTFLTPLHLTRNQSVTFAVEHDSCSIRVYPLERTRGEC